MKNQIIKFFCLLFFCGLAEKMNSQAKIVNTYRNPIIAGNLPDPSVIRVGENYYAAGTSSDYVPAYPLYQSTDLINWKRMGAIFTTPPTWIAGSFWAPELYYNNGTYFVYYTAKRKSDNVSCIGVATTKDINKGFQDQGMLIEWGKEAIDAFVFKDDDGKLYVTWKAYGIGGERPIEILGSELSADGLSLKGESFSLTQHNKGWVGRGDEGECLVKHDGYYYLLYSIGGCCDNRCTYNVRVARSKTLRNGNWEQYEEQALMEGGEQWVCTGHGTLVQTPDKRFFYLYHAYNVKDFEYIGRQAMLDEMLWDEKTGWPYFKYGNKPSLQAETPFKNTVQKRNTIFEDDFTSSENEKFWQWNMRLAKPEIVRSPKQLMLASNDTESAFLGLSPQTGLYTMETCVTNQSDNLKGLCIYGGPKNFLSLAVGKSEVVLYQMKDGIKQIISSVPATTNVPIYLKIEAINGRWFSCFWSYDQKFWAVCPGKDGLWEINGSGLPRWEGGLHTGLLVENTNGSTGVFSYFKMTYKF